MKLFNKEVTELEFIDAFGEIALKRYADTQVLPSLCICQAILESGWGTTTLSTYGNYHGMNYYADPVTAGCSHITMSAPQEVDGKIIYNREEFCIFTNIKEETDVYFHWLTRPNQYYQALHGCTDPYENFRNIKLAGYATDSGYIDKLTSIYNRFPSIKTWDDKARHGKTKTVYRVVTGSYEIEENAQKRVEELKQAGFDSFILRGEL